MLIFCRFLYRYRPYGALVLGGTVSIQIPPLRGFGPGRNGFYTDTAPTGLQPTNKTTKYKIPTFYARVETRKKYQKA